MARSMMIYWISGSAPCWKVMLTLEEKGIRGYGNKLISWDKNDHKSEEILKINPRGQVPTFRHGDVVVNESQAICDYLELSFPDQGSKLLPDDPIKMALVLQKKHEAYNLHSKGLEDVAYYVMATKKEDQDMVMLSERIEKLRSELGIWEAYMQKLGDNSFLTGGEFTLADVMFFPSLAFLWRLGLKLEKYPHLNSYFSNVQQRASVQTTWPPHWRDSPNLDLLRDI